MIIERPLRGRVDVQTPDYGRMGFVLGFSPLGTRLAGPGSTEDWESWIDPVTEIRARRGGTRTGLGLRTDVGLMTVVLRNAQDPAAGGTFQPGQLARIVADGHPVFTGRISAITGGYTLDKRTGTRTATTTVTVSDAVAIHGKTSRYGVRIPADYETFEARISRLAGSSRAPIAVPVEGAPVEVYAL